MISSAHPERKSSNVTWIGILIYKMLLVLIYKRLGHIGLIMEKVKAETFLALKFPNFIIDKLIQSTLE